MRDAPSLLIPSCPAAGGETVSAYESAGIDAARFRVAHASDAYDAAFRADRLVLMNEWSVSQSSSLPRSKAVMSKSAVVDQTEHSIADVR
jgi:UDP-glucose 6-dehydrogenase